MILKRGKTNRPRMRPDGSNVSSERPGRRVYSYYSSRGTSDEPSPEQRSPARDPKLASKFRLLPAIIAGVVIVASVLYSFTLGTYPDVEAVVKQPSPFRDISEYAEATDKALKKRLLNRTKFTIHTSDVETSLLNEYPELSDAVLRLPVLGRKPTLVVEIRQPVLLLATPSGVFVLDKDGVAVSSDDKLSPADKEGLPVIQDKSGMEVELGKQVLIRGTVQFIKDSIYQIKQKGLSVADITLPVSINEMDIRINGIQPYIKTDTSGDARLQMGSFFAALEHLREQGITPQEYIDVRVEEKVFYK